MDKEKKELMREEYLSGLDLTEEDVMEEPDGREYVMRDAQDDWKVDYKKEYLPENLQSLYVEF